MANLENCEVMTKTPKTFSMSMPPELPRMSRHFCFMVLAPPPPPPPPQSLQMSWPTSAHDRIENVKQLFIKLT